MIGHYSGLEPFAWPTLSQLKVLLLNAFLDLIVNFSNLLAILFIGPALVAVGLLRLGGLQISLCELRAVGCGSFHLAGEGERHGQRQHDAGERLEHGGKIGAEAVGVNVAGERPLRPGCHPGRA